MRAPPIRGWLLILAAALALGAPDPAGARSPGKQKSKRVLEGVVNVNTASAEQLALLPGIGPVVAARIVEARAERPFQQGWELTRVKGIGPKLYRRMEPHVQTTGETTLRWREPEGKKVAPRRAGSRRRGPKIIVFPRPERAPPMVQAERPSPRTVAPDFVGPPPLTGESAAD